MITRTHKSGHYHENAGFFLAMKKLEENIKRYLNSNRVTTSSTILFHD